MKAIDRMIWRMGSIALISALGLVGQVEAGGAGFFVEPKTGEARATSKTALTCHGPVGQVIDAADDAVNTTPATFGTNPGGGEGGQFDPTPVLSIGGVSLQEGECLNAHLSAIVGGNPTYGVAPLALFQVTLTAEGGSPRHMVGHYDTPYGIASPAVALEAERDVDMLAANFFQRVGTGTHEIPPGTYTVDVWWAGAPPGVTGGGIGASFVLKLYQRFAD